MTTSRDTLRALALAALMVLSVVAMGVSIAGVAAADHGTDTITVDDDDGANFTTIQAAINHANESDTIVVENGTYDGFVVNESVSVEAAEGATPIVTSDGVALEGSNRNVAVYIAADGVLVEGFELDGNAGTAKRGFGVDSVDELNLQDNLVHNFTTGASLQFSGPAPTNVRIEGNEFRDNTAGVGSTEDVTGLTIVGNDFIDNDESIGLGSGVGIESIADNEFVGDGEHVRIYDGASSPDLDSILEANDFNRAVSVTDGDVIWTSLEDAISAAASDDTIEVAAGTYDVGTKLQVPKTKSGLTIQASGDERPVIEGGDGDDSIATRILDVRGNGATLRGFEINSTVPDENVGVWVFGQDVTVEDNAISNVLTGIQTGHHENGNAQIVGNEISDATVGISLQNKGNTIENNDLAANTSLSVGYHRWNKTGGWSVVDNTIRRNSFTGDTGLRVSYNATVDATENWWGDTSGPSGEGPGSGAPIEFKTGVGAATDNASVTFDPWYENAGLSTLSNEEDDDTGPSITVPSDDDDEEEQQETPTPTEDEPPEGDVERQVTEEIADADPDTPGTTVTFDEAESSVNEITFEDEDSGEGGSVTVTEYSEVPEDLQDANGNDVVFAVDISVPEDRRDSPADVTMTLSQEQLGDQDPQDAQVAHRTDDGEWELLETEVVVSDDGEVTLTAETDGFSVFGVTFEQASTPTATAAPAETPVSTAPPDTAQPTDEPVEEPAGFDLTTIGVVVALVLVVIGLFAMARRRY